MTEAFDVAVVGAGPAGMAAAVAAGERGLRVVLVDAGRRTGGQYWRRPTDDAEPDARFADLHRRLAALGDAVRHVAGQQVWFVEAGEPHALHLSPTVDAAIDVDLAPDADRAPARVEARALVLCPGGYDRQLPVPGWTLPGVMAAGGVQALLKASGTLAGSRAVVAGTGPFLLPVAAGLLRAGAEVVALCEAGSPSGWARTPRGVAAVPGKAAEAAAYAATLARHRVRLRTRTVVTEVRGDDHVTSVRLGRLDRQGRLRPGDGVEVEADLVALGWGFTSSLELLTAVGAATRVDDDGSLVVVVDDGQRTDVPGVLAAGEATGVGGADLAVAEGELAGLTAARDAGCAVDEARVRSVRRTVRRHRAFAAAMHRAHPVPAGWREWLRPDTVVCRCEEVTAGEVRTACDDLGAADARTVKLLTRCGMGWCQGRVCGYATAALAAPAGATPSADDLRSVARRSLAAPVSLGELARGVDGEDD
ncbi:NAD(P)/FAD-dependent oxidoreductase [Nocardioides marinquilinus]|uniref:NAD(P)/FAD-dependent oxidoreductase n=1 Tax=Nocardioides marinquilinus TaxID=1210400 RepID=A0ABP9PRD2_9ACTN